MLRSNGKLFPLITIVFSLFFHVTESSAQQSTHSGFNPNDPPETPIRLAPYLTFGAQIEFEYKYDRNLDLDGSKDEDISTLEPAFVMAFSFDPSKYFQAYADMKLGGEFIFEDGRTTEDKITFEFERAYILFKNLWKERLALQLGRQRYEDERHWLYEAELDGVRTLMQLGNFSTELSVNRGGLVDVDLINNDVASHINNYIAYNTYTISEETSVSAYFLFRDDRRDEENSPIFFGAHSNGELAPDFDYWLELAYVIGKNGTREINGLGFDIGSTYVFDAALEPSITLGYAFGEEKFRQSGIQGNESDFNAVAEFLYYGEVFDPELSNMSIFTADAGVNPTEESSIDLVYHYYIQTKASDTLGDSALDAEPDGVNKSLGSEIDVVVGYEQAEEKFALVLTLGYFIPGSAFPPDSENAFSTKFIIEYQF